MISCSFSSLTRKWRSAAVPSRHREIPEVFFRHSHPAFGSRRRSTSNWRETSGIAALTTGAAHVRRLCADTADAQSAPLIRASKLVAHRAIGVEPLLAVALDVGRVGGRPVFDRGGDPVRELERLVVRLGRERDDQVEVEPVPDPRAPRRSSARGSAMSMPISSMAATANGSSSPLRTPAEATIERGAEQLRATAPPPSASAPHSARRQTARPAAVVGPLAHAVSPSSAARRSA